MKITFNLLLITFLSVSLFAENSEEKSFFRSFFKIYGKTSRNSRKLQKTQKIFQNMWAKHIVLFFLIYFTIDVVDRGDVPADPAKQLLDALALYLSLIHI